MIKRAGKWAVHVAAQPLASLQRPLTLNFKDVFYMDTIRRLVEAGIRPDCAVETVAWFRQQGDDRGLERYIQEAEKRAEGQKEKCECTE